MLMDQVEILHVCGYWSEILCCTITTHLSDLEVKVMGLDFDKFSDKAQVRRATLSCDSSYYSQTQALDVCGMYGLALYLLNNLTSSLLYATALFLS